MKSAEGELVVRTARVEAGATTTTDFALRLGEAKESVTVSGATPQIQYDSHQVGGLVDRGQIDNLPQQFERRKKDVYEDAICCGHGRC
jgi:hypothetical protein